MMDMDMDEVLARILDKRTTVFFADEQRLFRNAYQSFFTSDHPDVEMVGISPDTSGETLATANMALEPEVMLLGVKVLLPSVVEKLKMVREVHPTVSIVLLAAYYDTMGVEALRKFSQSASTGYAYLLKHTIDSVEQLTDVIQEVAQGRVMIDPMVMEWLMEAEDARSPVLTELSGRELEVLGWMARGYRDETIASVLCLEQETVERHRRSIYGKLGLDGQNKESRDPRVHAITKYLTATGLLTGLSFSEN